LLNQAEFEMIAFSIVELCNKLIGLLIVSYTARALSLSDFSSFSLALVIFGYLLEFSSFSFQTKNLLDFATYKNSFFLSKTFAARQKVVLTCSTISFFIFFVLSIVHFDIRYALLSLILFTPIFNVDYILYSNKKSQYIVLSRFLSQLFYGFIIFVSYQMDNLTVDVVLLGYIANSLLLTMIVMLFSKNLNLIDFSDFITYSFKTKAGFDLIKLVAFKQLPNIVTRVIVLVVVTIESALYLIFDGVIKEELSISYRMALILLPFIIFYLNSNVDSFSESDMNRKVLISSLVTCIIIIFSALIFRFMFGVKYVANSYDYAKFLLVIPFQCYLNYYVYWCLKNLYDNKLACMMTACFIFYTVLFVVLLKFGSVNDETLLYIMLLKFAIFVFASIQISLKSKLYILLCILSPYSLIFIGSAHFSEINFYLIQQIELIGFIL